MKEEKYYGIYFNDEIPKLDKVNKFSKQVKIKFEGIAYLTQKNKQKHEKIELKSGDIIEKEGDYEIEITNLQNKIYCLNLKIKSSIVPFLLLFLIILVILIFFDWPVSKNSPLAYFLDQIDISVIPVEINQKRNDIEILKNSEKQNKSKKVEEKKNLENEISNKHSVESTDEKIRQYDFEVQFDKTSFISDIDLLANFSGDGKTKNKAAPGVSGSFMIQLSTKKSAVDMNYKIEFQDILNQKPQNMVFKIRGKNEEYHNLQDLQNELKGRIDKNSIRQIIIDWFWPYESGNDEKDTNDGINLALYKFNILVTGEEVI